MLGLAISSQFPVASLQSRMTFWKLDTGNWKLQFFNLQEIQFDRRRSSEDRHHDLQRVAVEVHLVHGPIEARERTFVDADLVALFERVLWLRLLGRDRHLLQDLIDLFARQRRRLGPRADEA